MKHLELHIIQSVPVSCLNRDDLGSPKTAIFGGVQRARVSSQSWKRAIREMLKEMDQNVFGGNRTRLMVGELVNRLVKKDISTDVATIISEGIASRLETLDKKKDDRGFYKIKTLMFFSPFEYDAIITAISDEIIKAANDLAKVRQDKPNTEDERKKYKKSLEEKEKIFSKLIEKSPLEKAIDSVQLKDAADIALFGRMVASNPNLTLEASTMFSHALSVHRAENEIDFFAAIDDLQSKDVIGAAHTSTLEFSSATYYRFCALNLDMLADKKHLGALTSDERKTIVRIFVEAVIKAIPSGRKATMNGNTMPDYVLGIVRYQGHPIQLVNAFEKPLYSKLGYKEDAIKALNQEYNKLESTWGIEAKFKQAIPEKTFSEFLDEITNYVI